jgi:hypothetical protein
MAEAIALQRQLAERWPAVAVLALHVLLWLLVFHTIEEDAFIYLRFAENIRDGHGYVFNPGGEPVESGTSLIWLLLLTLTLHLPLSPIIAIKLLSLAFSLLTIITAGQFVFVKTKSEAARLTVMALLAISYPMVFWSGQGLETPLVAFLLAANLLCMFDPARRRWLWMSCAALALVRPEAPIYLSIVILWGALRWRSGDRDAAREALRGVLASAVLLALCTLWRIFYFGDLTAHTFYFKFEHLAVSPLSLLAAANAHLRLDLFAAPIVLALILRREKFADLWPLMLAVVLQLAWYANLTDHFAYERQFVPGLAPFYVLTVIAWWMLTSSASQTLRPWALGAIAALPLITLAQYRENPLLLLGGAFVRAPGTYASAVVGKMIEPQRTQADYVDNRLHGGPNDLKVSAFAITQNWEARIGRFLAANYPQGSLVAYHEMGQTPYYAGADMRFIDTVGLVTPRVGYYRFGAAFKRRPLARQFWQVRCAIVEPLGHDHCPSLELTDTVDYILDQRPDVVMAARYIVQASGDRAPLQALLRDDRFREHYRRRYLLNNQVVVFERDDRNFPVFSGRINGLTIRTVGQSRPQRPAR